MRRAKSKRGQVQRVVERIAQRGGRSLARRRELARKAMVGALVPLAVAAGQGLMMRLDGLPSCEVRQARGSFLPAGEAEGALESRPARSVRLASGIAVGGQAVLVTLSVCGHAGENAAAEAVALRVELVGALGSFAAAVSWRRAQ